jgi:hypothetical protein
VWWGQLLDQQKTLTDIVHGESKFREDLCWKQLDLFEDEMSYNVPAMREALGDEKLKINSLRFEKVYLKGTIRLLQAQLDEQVKVFIQSDLILCIRKYFYTFELFTDS